MIDIQSIMLLVFMFSMIAGTAIWAMYHAVNA